MIQTHDSSFSGSQSCWRIGPWLCAHFWQRASEHLPKPHVHHFLGAGTQRPVCSWKPAQEPRTCIADWLLPGCPPWLKSPFPLFFGLQIPTPHTTVPAVWMSKFHLFTHGHGCACLCLNLFLLTLAFPLILESVTLRCVPGLSVLAVLCPWTTLCPWAYSWVLIYHLPAMSTSSSTFHSRSDLLCWTVLPCDTI